MDAADPFAPVPTARGQTGDASFRPARPGEYILEWKRASRLFGHAVEIAYDHAEVCAATGGPDDGVGG